MNTLVNCWKCHLTARKLKVDDGWISLAISVETKGLLNINPDFCSEEHKKSWLKDDFVPVLPLDALDGGAPSLESPESSTVFVSSGWATAFVGQISQSFLSSGAIPSAHIGGSCSVCAKKKVWMTFAEMTGGKSTERRYCSLECFEFENSLS